MYATSLVWRSEVNLQVLVFSLWSLGIELRSPGLGGMCFYLQGHLTGLDQSYHVAVFECPQMSIC